MQEYRPMFTGFSLRVVVSAGANQQQTQLRYLILTVALLVCACAPQDPDVIRFGLASVPTSLDPRYATDAVSERINRLIYQQLVDFDEQARPVPALATWEKLSDLHYRFRLREEVARFHNGEPLTAADAAATYRSILAPDSGSPHRGTLELIERIDVIDSATLDFVLKRPDALFPGYLSIGILPNDLVMAGMRVDRQPLGSGPFRFAGWSDSTRLELVRIRDGQRFVFEEIRDPTMRVLKLLRGEIDLLQNDLPPELLSYLREQPGIEIGRTAGSNFAYVGFQLEDTETGRWEVRRAVALAIDRQAIIRHVFKGAARPASALLTPEHWAGNPRLPEIHPDPDRARALLARAGYGAQNPLRLTYKTSSDPFRLRIATIVQQQLADVGITVDIQSYDWGTFYSDIKSGRFQMYSLAWVGVKVPDIFRYAFHSESLPPQGANRGRLNDARVDAMIEQAMAAQDLSQQAQGYARLQAYLLQQLPYVPLWYEDQFYALRKEIEGYELAADGNYDALVNVHRTVSSRFADDNED
ncbi:ABC transporter substrate-binding protein [Thiogranum longum]